MKFGTEIETDRLVIRHWTRSEEDRRALHVLMSDETIRRFYDTRLTREESDDKLEHFIERLPARGYDWAAVCLKGTSEPIGVTGLAQLNDLEHLMPAVEIGWLYHPSQWGKGFATEAAKALIKQGFEELNLNEIIAFAVHNNTASLAVMERVGMVQDEGGTFDHPGISQDYPHLRRHLLYRIKNPSMQEQKRADA